MFRTVFPSIIRSSRLYTQQQAYVKMVVLSAWQREVAASYCWIQYRNLWKYNEQVLIHTQELHFILVFFQLSPTKFFSHL